METRQPTITNIGLYADHDQCCAVFHGEPAVMGCADEIFRPSWKAQREGWQLVRADSWIKKLALRIFFSAS